MPPTPTTTSGRSFSAVVTICTRAGDADARDVDPDHQPDDRRPPSRRPIAGVRTSRGNERIEVADTRNRQGGERADNGEPVSPRDEKAGDVAERVRACRRTVRPRPDGGRASRANTSASATAPAADTTQPARLRPTIGSKRRRQQEHARTDHVARDDRNGGPETEDAGLGRTHADGDYSWRIDEPARIRTRVTLTRHPRRQK